MLYVVHKDILNVYNVGKMKRVLVNLTEKQLEELDEMVKEGVYTSRAEAVRDGIRLLAEAKKLKKLQEKME
jgi:Arc/MetJ-type ribon-helix-helix transcriptional regulator